VGLPRSNLLKPKTPEAVRPVAVAPAAPFVPMSAPVVASPFEVASTMAFAPMGVPVAPQSAPADASRQALDTKADSIEVQLDQTARGSSMDDFQPPRGDYPSALSKNELLERAAAMGPARMTWESIVLPADPVLDEKQTPHVAERRARLTRIVKVTLGACLGVCVIALAVSAISGSGDSSSSSKTEAAATATSKTVASKPIVPVETMDGAKRRKARPFTPAVTTAAIVRPKRR